MSNCTAPVSPESDLRESGDLHRTSFLPLGGSLTLCRGYIPDRAAQHSIVEPVHPIEGNILHGFDSPPVALSANDLGLEQSDYRLGHRVVVEVASAANRHPCSGIGETFRVVHRQITATTVRMADDSARTRSCP